MSVVMAVAAMILTAPAAAVAADRTERSWGRAGVSFDAYRADAIACARVGADTEIGDQPAAQRIVQNERLLDRMLNVDNQVGAVDFQEASRRNADLDRRMRPAAQVKAIQDVLVSATERCLLARGYRPFVLTRAQRKALGRLRPGTPARHAYLHALASDPLVLATQTVPAG